MQRLLEGIGRTVGHTKIVAYLIALGVATVLICSLALSAYRIGEPAWEGGYQGFVLSEYPQNASNFLRWGYLATGFGPVMDVGDNRPAQGFEYRFSHGNITALLISVSYRLFGISEWSARLPVIAVALLGAITTGLLGFRLTRSRLAGLAAFVFAALNPLQLFYARLPGPHLLATTFALLAFYAYWRWFETGKRHWLIQIFAWLAIGVWTDWIAYFAFPALLAHFAFYRLRRRRADWVFAAGLAAAPLLLFGSYLLWVTLLSRQGLPQLQAQILMRSGEGGGGIFPYTTAEFVSITSSWTLIWLTVVVVALTLVWLARLIGTLYHLHVPPADGLLALIFAAGITHNLLLPSRVIVHDFIMLWHLAPAFAIAAGIGLQIITARARARSGLLAVAVVAVAFALFADQSLVQYRRAHIASKPDNAPALESGHALRQLIPSTGRYAALNIELGYITRAATDRAGDAVKYLEPELELVRHPAGYDAIMVSHASPPPPEVVRELFARYPRYVAAGYSIFLVGNDAPRDRLALAPNATPSHPQHIVFDNHLEFLGYDMEPMITRTAARPDTLAYMLSRTPELLPEYSTVMRVTLYWRKLSARAEAYDLSARFIPLVGERMVLTAQYPGTDKLWPTNEWPVDQIVRDEFELRVPTDAPNRRYGLWVGVNQELLALEPQTDGLAIDSSNRVLVGATDIRPSQAPATTPTNDTPAQPLQIRVTEDLELTGYSTSVTREGLAVRTFWERQGGNGDFAFALELEQAGGDTPLATIEIAPPRLWQPGQRYDATTIFPAYTPDADYQLTVIVSDEQGGSTRVPLTAISLCNARAIQAQLATSGSSGDEPSGNLRIAPGQPVTLAFDLDKPHDLSLHVAWTGRSEQDRILFQVVAFNTAWQVGSPRKLLTTIEARRGEAGATQITIPRRLTIDGHNTIELSIPEHALVGWRALAAVVAPPIAPALANEAALYQGWVELDSTRAFMTLPQTTGDSAYSALTVDTLNTTYENARLSPNCNDANTIELLGQELDTKLALVNWDELPITDILTLQQQITRPHSATLNASLVRRIATSEDVTFTLASQPIIKFLGYSQSQPTDADGSGDELELVFYFQSVAAVPQDLMIWLHGMPLDAESLPPERRKDGYENLDHWPSTATTRWQPGGVYISTYRMPLPPAGYRMRLGLLQGEPFQILESDHTPELIIERSATGANARHAINGL